MNLLFDVSLAGSSIPAEDVRDLTGPIWRLAENSQHSGSYGNPPLCRFVWGKSWHIPGIVTAVAERLEYFTPDGSPRRSWLRLRLRRVLEPVVTRPPVAGPQRSAPSEIHGFLGLGDRVEAHEVLGGERPDQIAHSSYGDPNLSRALMDYNDIDDPLHIPIGTILDLPPLSALENLL